MIVHCDVCGKDFDSHEGGRVIDEKAYCPNCENKISDKATELYNMLITVNNDFESEGCDGCGTISTETIEQVRKLIKKYEVL